MMESLKSWCKYQAPENILEGDIAHTGTKRNALRNIHKTTKEQKSTLSDKPVFKTESSQIFFFFHLYACFLAKTLIT